MIGPDPLCHGSRVGPGICGAPKKCIVQKVPHERLVKILTDSSISQNFDQGVAYLVCGSLVTKRIVLEQGHRTSLDDLIRGNFTIVRPSEQFEAFTAIFLGGLTRRSKLLREVFRLLAAFVTRVIQPACDLYQW